MSFSHQVASNEQDHPLTRGISETRAHSGLPSLLTNKLEHDQTGKGPSVSVSEDGKLIHPEPEVGLGHDNHNNNYVPGMVEKLDDCHYEVEKTWGLQERRAARRRLVRGGPEEAQFDGARKCVAGPPPGLELLSDAEFCEQHHSPNQHNQQRFHTHHQQSFSQLPPPPPPPPPGLPHSSCTLPGSMSYSNLASNCPPKLGGSSLSFLSTSPLSGMPPPPLSSSSSLALSSSASPSPSMRTGFGGNRSGLGAPPPPMHAPPSAAALLLAQPPCSPPSNTPTDPAYGLLATPAPTVSPSHNFEHLAPPSSPPGMLQHFPACTDASARGGVGIGHMVGGFNTPQYNAAGNHNINTNSNNNSNSNGCNNNEGHCLNGGSEQYQQEGLMGSRCFRAAPLTPGLVHPGCSPMIPSPAHGAGSGFSPMSPAQSPPYPAPATANSSGRRPLPADTRTLGLSL